MTRRYRSAVTGRYVSREYAEAHPDTTVAEEVSEPEGHNPPVTQG